jgi:predicted regulator of amino acid metabolism with ACT domain
VEEMDVMSKDAAMQAVHRAGVQGSVAIAYTVWAKKKGGGKHMVNEVYKMIKESNHLNRLVTLSPLTDMARKFHLKNGAKEVQVNLTTQNFEYDIELEKWEVFKNRAKGWFNIK